MIDPLVPVHELVSCALSYVELNLLVFSKQLCTTDMVYQTRNTSYDEGNKIAVELLIAEYLIVFVANVDIVFLLLVEKGTIFDGSGINAVEDYRWCEKCLCKLCSCK